MCHIQFMLSVTAICMAHHFCLLEQSNHVVVETQHYSITRQCEACFKKNTCMLLKWKEFSGADYANYLQCWKTRLSTVSLMLSTSMLLGYRKGIWPVKTWSTYLEKFCFCEPRLACSNSKESWTKWRISMYMYVCQFSRFWPPMQLCYFVNIL